MIDTHCHLNFEAFSHNVGDVIRRAHAAGVGTIIIPSTNVPTAQRAIEICRQHATQGVYGAVGIHPHHVFELAQKTETIDSELAQIRKMLSDEAVVAVGEVGLDRHYYKNTKYSAYEINETFMKVQKEVFQEQVRMAIEVGKSLVLHNREAREEFVEVLLGVWDAHLEQRTVFHCCEPSRQLLATAKERKIFIGIDGDITYYKEKQQFIAEVPLDMIVLETDAPFLSPEPFRSQPRETRPPNEPANISLIAQTLARIKSCSVEDVIRSTTENAQTLFGLSSS